MQAEDFIQYKNIVLEIREVKKDGYKCSWKSHATLTLLATQDCPLWLQYD